MKARLLLTGWAIGLVALAAVGLERQWLLPAPTYDPFDEQWLMSGWAVAKASDQLIGESCGYRRYVNWVPAGEIGYQNYYFDSLVITGKSLFALVDTVRWDSLEEVHIAHGHRSRSEFDSCAVSDISVGALDAIAATFGLASPHDGRARITLGYQRRYLTSDGDTVRFDPTLDFRGLHDICAVRRGYLFHKLRPEPQMQFEYAGHSRWGALWYYVRQFSSPRH